MLKKIFLTFLFILQAFLAGAVFAGETKEVALKDGSVITGELVSFSGGVYTIKSESLGTIKIDDSRVLSIQAKGSGGEYGSERENAAKSQSDTLQQKMMNDEQIMGIILSLQQDPEFMEILQDPSIMNAVNSGDISALTSNPKFMKLLNNSKVRDITRKVGE